MVELRCRQCGTSFGVGVYSRGCPSCIRRDSVGILEVVYEYDGDTKYGLQRAFDDPQHHCIWRFNRVLPLPASKTPPVTLGEGGTPLLEASWLSPTTMTLSVFLKNDTANPTWCSKDRGNSVSISVARALDLTGVVASTAGNHGASVAAYCARASMPVVVICSPQSDIIHRAMITAYGGTTVVAANPDVILRYLVYEHNWFAATSMCNANAPNPYGVEGYKTIAFEIYEDLGGSPDAVFIPAASGDLLYGVYKGFRELLEFGFIRSCPRIIGCQSEGAAPLALTLHDHLADVPVISNPSSVAISISDATGGKHAVEAVAASSGDFVTVTDEQILMAQARLAANGLLVEAASAATVAALSAAARTGVVASGERLVVLLTGSGLKWSTQLLSAGMNRVLVEPTLSTLIAAI